ncbi:MAG TPA: GHMP kinase [Candidatus Limnocylindria bacterium]|nr:GHMP kinase [Candidatus Limnocylindria bacterium]
MTQTPLRISFAGGGTDLEAFYQHDEGAVFSTSIDKYVYVTVKRHGPVFDEKIRLNYSVSESVGEIDAIRNDIARECLRLMEVEPPIYVSVVSDLPDSSGLGGSSAFAVGLLHALHTFKGERVTGEQLAEEASRVEIEILGQPIGKQDQYAAAVGGLNLLSFRAGMPVSVSPHQGSSAAIDGLFDRLIMLWTGHQRRSSGVLFEQRDRTSDHRQELARMREQAYELQALMADTQPDYRRFGEVLLEGWRLKRGLASSVSNPQIDGWYEAAIQAGAIGGKLCGAGSGGFLLFLAETDRLAMVRESLADLKAVPIAHESRGSRVLLAQVD